MCEDTSRWHVCLPEIELLRLTWKRWEPAKCANVACGIAMKDVISLIWHWDLKLIELNSNNMSDIICVTHSK